MEYNDAGSDHSAAFDLTVRSWITVGSGEERNVSIFFKGQSSPKRCFSGITLTYQELTISKTRLLQGFIVTSEQRLILECMTYKARLKLRIGM